jgi:hypothetical protein
MHVSPKVKSAKWSVENIRLGIDRFLMEEGRAPTAHDFDETIYLPSARQIQRVYGGLVKLREALGYTDLDFTKGSLRQVIAASGNKLGITAENYLETILIDKFGETYVHTQKRYYKGSKNRYDFLVYARNATFGIDVFTTSRASYINKNIRHKILRYKHVPQSINVYFVLIGESYTGLDVARARESVRELAQYPNLLPLCEIEFLALLNSFEPLSAPEHFIALGSQKYTYADYEHLANI